MYSIGLMNVAPLAGKVDEEIVVWAADFQCETGRSIIHFKDLVPMSQGRTVLGTYPPLDLSNIRRFSIACHSFSGQQEGFFWLRLKSIFPLRPGQPNDAGPLVEPEAEPAGKEAGPDSTAASEQDPGAPPQDQGDPTQEANVQPEQPTMRRKWENTKKWFRAQCAFKSRR